MNFRKGFFRIWVVGSILFAGAIAVLSYDSVRSEFEKAGQDWASQGILLVPVNCRDVRGKANVDYTPPEGPWNAYTNEAQCWYRIDVLRRLYPEYNDLSDDHVSDKLYKEAGIVTNPAKPWSTLTRAVMLAAGIPAFLLVLGAALGWALSGFSSRPKQKSDRRPLED